MRATLVRVALAPALLACGVARPSPSRGPGDNADVDATIPQLVPAAAAPAESPEETAAGSAAAPTFTPRDVGPIRAGGPDTDGRWSPVSVENDAGSGAMWKAVLHPDKSHPSAELFVVAIDLSRGRLHSVAGESEPVTEVPSAKGYARGAVVPPDRRDVLLAAFNGGWKGEHGHYGIKVDGVTLVKPREGACTIAAYEDDSLRIAPWADVAADEPRTRLLRQTPACMYTTSMHRSS